MNKFRRYSYEVVSVVFDDWGTPGTIYPIAPRIIQASEYEIYFNYDKNIMMFNKKDSEQREVVPMSRVYSILEEKVYEDEA